MTAPKLTVVELRELIAYQRQHARHGFGSRMPSTLDEGRALHKRLTYLQSETIDGLFSEALRMHARIVNSYGDDKAGRQLMREQGVHNVSKLLQIMNREAVRR